VFDCYFQSSNLKNTKFCYNFEIMTEDVQGLTYTPSFLTANEEMDLLRRINAQPWSTALKRRVQHYGRAYDYQSRALAAHPAEPLPDWLAALAGRVGAVAPGNPRFDQVIVNEYTPGQGISAHVDQPAAFGPVVATVSLGSDVVMDFARGSRTVPVLLERRSLACLDGPARSAWTHGIAARQSDMVHGRRRARGTRVSITFRTVRPVQQF